MSNKTVQRIMELKPQRRTLNDNKILEKAGKQKMNIACNLTVLTVFTGFALIITLMTSASYSFLKNTQQKIADIKNERLEQHIKNEEGLEKKQDSKQVNSDKGITFNNTESSNLAHENDKSKLADDEKSKTELTNHEQKASDTYAKWIKQEIQDLKVRLKDFPFLAEAIQQASVALEDRENLNSLATKLTKASGGVLGTLQVIAGSFVNIILDMFMGFFFFIFFLKKMALFQLVSGDKSTGQYIIDGIFNSSWTPSLQQETQEEAINILDVIIEKMQRWVKGCMFIIIIELPIFLIVFSIMGVPFAIPLAIISSLQVLLPFLGPIIAIALTFCTCLFNGITDPAFYLGLVLTYFLIVTLLEGFFLYPKLVGASLGLTLLETIIVVLLGGIFAGIGGAIFGVPAASVFKYLSPRIYRSIFAEKESTENSNQHLEEIPKTS